MLDPRTKLLLAIFYAVLVIVTNHNEWLLAEGGVLLLFLTVLGKMKAYLRWLCMVLPMALFFGAVTWWTADLTAAMLAALNLILLVSVFFVFFSTTAPEDLGNSLVKLGLPYSIAFVFSTSLQFVPIIGRKSKNVLDAQRARGIPLEPGWRALRQYINRRTLIVGDVNTGKTGKTLEILAAFVEAGYAGDIAVLDFSPDPVAGVGGKMKLPQDPPLFYLTALIHAPRMTGRDARHMRQLACENAGVIEAMFVKLLGVAKTIIFVNDATLYLHAGDLKRFLDMLKPFPTQIMNAFLGDRFTDSALTRREKQLTQRLMAGCNNVITLK